MTYGGCGQFEHSTARDIHGAASLIGVTNPGILRVEDGDICRDRAVSRRICCGPQTAYAAAGVSETAGIRVMVGPGQHVDSRHEAKDTAAGAELYTTVVGAGREDYFAARTVWLE